MYWFFIPVFIVIALIAITVAIIAGNARRRGGAAQRQPGQTVYDVNQQRKPDAPPA